MAEKDLKNGKGRPVKAIVDLEPIVQWLVRNLSELSGKDIPTKGIIDATPLIDYFDQRIEELRKELSPLEDFFERVVKPSHRKMAKNTEELQKGVKIEEALEKIKDLTGEERKKALRKLILGVE